MEEEPSEAAATAEVQSSPWVVTNNVKVQQLLASVFLLQLACFTGGVLAAPGSPGEGKTRPQLHQISA